MPNTSFRREIATFTRGLITEATQLTFPQNAAVDWLNFDLNSKGVACRRRGIDYEDSYAFRVHRAAFNSTLILWEEVAGDSDTAFVVVHDRESIKAYTAGASLSSSAAAWTIDLEPFMTRTQQLSISGSYDMTLKRGSFAVGNGKLYFVHAATDILEITYDLATASVSTASYPVRIRDFDGEALEAPFDQLDYQPATAELTEKHWYNLANQGWSNRYTEAGVINTNRSTWPGNHEQWQFGKAVNGTTGIESFSWAHYSLQDFGNSRAPQGRVVHNAFQRDDAEIRFGLTGTGTPVTANTDETKMRITATAHGLVAGNFVNFDTAAWDFDNGGGCPGVAFDPQDIGTRAITYIDANNFEVDTFDTTNRNNPYPLDASTNGTTLGINCGRPHGLTTGDRVRFASASWNYDSGGGCPGTAFDPSSLGWVTATVTSAYAFTVPATLTGFVTWCTFLPEASYLEVSRTGNFNAWCTTPAANWYQVAKATYPELNTRPQVNTFFKTRHVCAGVAEDGVSSNIYISKVLFGDNTDPGRCYQDADPTSEHSNALVATDGFVINISGCTNVLGLAEFQNGVLVFAQNGIWYINGGGSTFSAINWNVDKISKVNCTSIRGHVEVEDVIYVWAKQGIYRITQPDQDTLPVAENVVRDTLQSWYNDLTDDQRASVDGSYNRALNKIFWIYESSKNGVFSIRNNILVHDLNFTTPISESKVQRDTFYPFTIPDGELNIYAVVETTDYTSEKIQTTKFLIHDVGTSNVTFADFNNLESLDWYTFDSTGVDAVGYLESAYDVGNSASLEKQNKYVTCYFNRTEQNVISDGMGGLTLDNQSGVLLRGKWDFTDSVTPGKWSAQKQAYRFTRPVVFSMAGPFDYGYDVIKTKNKIRGSGTVLRLRFDTQVGKQCELIGWSNNIEERTTE